MIFFKKKATHPQSGQMIEARVANSKIYAEGIRKVYQGKEEEIVAIRDVSLEILENEFISIVGPSGCGKSTLLRILAGLDEVSGGIMMINDRPIEGPGADRGMVFQSYTLFPWLTVADNIRFGLTIKKMPKKEANEIVDRYLEIIKLTAFRNSYPKELSGGMKQRVAIARALANCPEVLLMDEPFGALDSQTKAEMQSFMREVWKVEKPTVIFITHDIEEAVFLSSRIYVMSGRPSVIKASVPILLPYERKLDLKDKPEFVKLRHAITCMLHES